MTLLLFLALWFHTCILSPLYRAHNWTLVQSLSSPLGTVTVWTVAAAVGESAPADAVDQGA